MFNDLATPGSTLRKPRQLNSLLGSQPGAAVGPPASPMAAPAQSSTIQTPYTNPAPDLTGKQGLGGKGLQRGIGRLNFGNAVNAQGPLWQQIYGLQSSANTFDPSAHAQQYAGQYENLNDRYQHAQGALTQNLEARGLGDSSAMASGLGQLAGDYAGAQSGLANQIYGQEQGRQRQDQGLLRDLLMSLSGRSSNQAADVAGQYRSQNLQQQQMANQQGSLFDNLLGGLGSLGGQFLGNPNLYKIFGGGK